jgi:hypothetical protein
VVQVVHREHLVVQEHQVLQEHQVAQVAQEQVDKMVFQVVNITT